MDPINALPTELVTSSFSYLTASSLARSSAVSTNWRRQVQSDAPLHRTLDLLDRSKLSELETIKTVYQLGSKAPRKFTKILLDLSRFYKNWYYEDEEERLERSAEEQNFK